jgi:hypothetical protein
LDLIDQFGIHKNYLVMSGKRRLKQHTNVVLITLQFEQTVLFQSGDYYSLSI